MRNDHPLIRAIKLRDQAIKCKADKLMINRLDQQVKEIAMVVVGQWSLTEKSFPVLNSLRDRTPLKLKEKKDG